jgi:phosphoglycolate phosphatase-like HAD superfamily hydrolase
MKKAIFFGSIGAIMETSDIQRQAYNQALKEAGLPWHWNREVYADLLEQSGGKDRLTTLAAATGFDLSQDQINSIHARKMEIACAKIISTKPAPRPCVIALAQYAKTCGIRLGFVTTTYKPNIDAIFDALGDSLKREDFGYIAGR